MGIRKYLTGKNVLHLFWALGVCSSLITVGPYFNRIIHWSMANILCQTGFRIALCSILFTILVFSVNPILTKFKVSNRTVKVLIGIIVFMAGCWVISVLPKGNCEMAQLPQVVKSADATAKANRKFTDTTSYITQQPTTNVPKAPERKKSSSPGFKFNLDHPKFYGPTQLGDGNTQKIYSSNDPIAPSKEIIQATCQNLANLRSKYPSPPTVETQTEAGSSIRDSVSLLIARAIYFNHLPARYSTAYNMGLNGGYPVTLICTSDYSDYANDLMAALKPQLDCKYRVFNDTGTHYILFYIRGTPFFNGDGAITIK
jgi:hypothetical protein